MQPKAERCAPPGSYRRWVSDVSEVGGPKSREGTTVADTEKREGEGEWAISWTSLWASPKGARESEDEEASGADAEDTGEASGIDAEDSREASGIDAEDFGEE